MGLLAGNDKVFCPACFGQGYITCEDYVHENSLCTDDSMFGQWCDYDSVCHRKISYRDICNLCSGMKMVYKETMLNYLAHVKMHELERCELIEMILEDTENGRPEKISRYAGI